MDTKKMARYAVIGMVVGFLVVLLGGILLGNHWLASGLLGIYGGAPVGAVVGSAFAYKGQ